MTNAGVRVVGPAALKTLMAYGGMVLDTRCPDGLSDLPQRLAVLTPDREQLVLLLVEDAATSLPAAHALHQQGYRSVVLVSPAPAPAAPAPDQRPG
jgi:hypothetical protein